MTQSFLLLWLDITHIVWLIMSIPY